MALPILPTKGNLINAKKTLNLARLGYELLDRKRNILIREMMQLIDTANSIRGEIEDTYRKAYIALQKANISLGVCDNIAKTIPIDNGITISYRSVMGVDIPHVTYDQKSPEIYFGFAQTNSQLDYAYICFEKAKNLTVVLAEIENSVYRLANAIKKTQRRANALKNIIIPQYEHMSKFITDALEEKEREEFSRLKVIKATKLKLKSKDSQ